MILPAKSAWRLKPLFTASQNALQIGPAGLRWRSAAPSLAIQEDYTAAESEEWENARPYSEIPGPKPSAIVGNAWRFIPGIGDFAGMKQKTFMEHLHNNYGPIVKLEGLLGTTPIVFTNHPDFFETILRNDGQWPIRRGIPSMEYYTTVHRPRPVQSLATAQGKDWGEFRSAVNQVMMQPRNAKQYVEPIDEVATEFLARLPALRDAKGQMPDDFSDELSKWAMETINFLALDTRLHALSTSDPNSEAMKMIRALKELFRCMHELDFRPSVWKYVTTPTLRSLIKSMDYLSSISDKYVNQAIQRLKATPPSEFENRNLTVLEKLLLSSDDPSKAVQMATDMIIAGIDTTSVGASSIFYQLAKHPEKQRKLQEELDRVIPDPEKRLTSKQMEELKYMKACIKEAFRIEPVVAANGRDAGKNLVLGGYRIPKNTSLVMNHQLACLNEEYFPRANEFIPERWLPEGSDLKAKHPFAFLPFGFGPRMCIGRRFADLEMEILTTRMFRHFSLEWEHAPPESETLAVLRFISPLKFTVRDRSS